MRRDCRLEPRPSEITPEPVWRERRRFTRLATALALAGCGADEAPAEPAPQAARVPAPTFGNLQRWPGSTRETPTLWSDVTSYNNYYEFGTGKADPARRAANFQPRPWTVQVDGHAERTGRFDLDDLVPRAALEERIYRLRCVEAWSMVIPWVGVPLGKVLAAFRPTSRAKFVAFTTLYAPDRMPGQRIPVLRWPYREALRIDEAMHPLALLAVGVYGRELPNQNGAPLRLVVPWKYGFKSIKAIAKIAFVESMPRTSWNESAPEEYGFYANVNPEVDHPRWSQRTERRIAPDRTIFDARIPTLPFNGYAEQVAGLYAGMDLRSNY